MSRQASLASDWVTNADPFIIERERLMRQEQQNPPVWADGLLLSDIRGCEFLTGTSPRWRRRVDAPLPEPRGTEARPGIRLTEKAAD